MSVHDIVELLKEAGVSIAVLAYFIWMDYRSSKQSSQEREMLSERIKLIEDYQRNELETIARNATDALNQNTQTLKDFLRTPCLVKANEKSD